MPRPPTPKAMASSLRFPSSSRAMPLKPPLAPRAQRDAAVTQASAPRETEAQPPALKMPRPPKPTAMALSLDLVHLPRGAAEIGADDEGAEERGDAGASDDPGGKPPLSQKTWALMRRPTKPKETENLLPRRPVQQRPPRQGRRQGHEHEAVEHLQGRRQRPAARATARPWPPATMAAGRRVLAGDDSGCGAQFSPRHPPPAKR